MIPGETKRSGAPVTCAECGETPPFEVLMSNAGFYIGTRCDCGPRSRESEYDQRHEDAERDVTQGTVRWRREGA